MKCFWCLIACVIFGIGKTAEAQTFVPPAGYHQETIQILVPDTPTVAVPTPSIGQPSATAAATGPGAHASAGVNSYGALPQGPVWQPYCPPQPAVQTREILLRETRGVVAVSPWRPAQQYQPGPQLLPRRCRGNLFGRCPCGRHVGAGVGVGAGVYVGGY